jgi:hypothetical protein
MFDFVLGVYLGGLFVSLVLLYEERALNIVSVLHAVVWPYPIIKSAVITARDTVVRVKPYACKAVALAKVLVGKLVAVVNKLRGKSV